MNRTNNDINSIHYVCDFFAGWMSYGCALLFSHPMDTMRVRWQTLGNNPSVTLRSDGVRSLYSGITTPLAFNGALVSTVFGLFEGSKALICSVKGIEQPTLTDVALAGGMSGVLNSMFVCPITTLKLLQQTSNARGQQPLTFRSAAQRLWRSEGVKGFYRGVPYEAIAGGIGRTMYFTTYDAMKQLSHATFGGEITDLRHGLLSSTVVGFTGWIFIFPIDIIKVKLQADGFGQNSKFNRSFSTCCRHVYAQQGWRGFWTGFSLTVLRSTLVAMMTLPMYDNLRPKFRGKANELGFTSTSTNSPNLDDRQWMAAGLSLDAVRLDLLDTIDAY